MVLHLGRSYLWKTFFRHSPKGLKRTLQLMRIIIESLCPRDSPWKLHRKSLLTVNMLFKRIQYYLLSEYDVEDSYPASAVIAETGNSSFNCQKLKLPMYCGYEESQMRYGCTGWSLGATLGYAQATHQLELERVITCIDARSFQVAAQEISTMLEYGHITIIFLINSGAYTAETEDNRDFIMKN